MPGPLPKPSYLRRRGTLRAGTRLLPSEPLPGPIPLLGRKPGGGAWHQVTREWWEGIWRSPMAHAWVETDVSYWVIWRMAGLFDQSVRGKASAALIRELRIHEDVMGMTPYGRRRLEWELEPAAPADVVEISEGLTPAQRARRRRLEAEPGGANDDENGDTDE